MHTQTVYEVYIAPVLYINILTIVLLPIIGGIRIDETMVIDCY